MFKTFLFIFCFVQASYHLEITVHGPGLQPREIVFPARYFFVNLTFVNEDSYTLDIGNDVAVEINGQSNKHQHCRIWANKLDKKDGTFIVRYKVYETCQDLSISIYYKSKHIKGSPFTFTGPILADQCNCPTNDIETWLQQYSCPTSIEQINNDLQPFKNLNMTHQVNKIIDKYHRPDSRSFCHYVIKNNEIYRDCYGKHVGFNMFSDNLLLFLTRKLVLPDLELIFNLGDWPLVHKDAEHLPVFSWCGSDDTLDIVMPTYDITESTLENMGRVTLDILSVQGGVERKWSNREPRAFWRGRDSRAERLKLVDIARANPDLFNVSITNFFFFKHKENDYGPKQRHISFFKFFDYKYQINVDGTVAAYRLPYLLAGGGAILKQDSPYYEHFYKQLRAWEHYVPVARDLSDLEERVQWLREHDHEAYNMAKNARKFANEHLLPQHIVCYYTVLLWEWSKRIDSKITVRDGMTHVPQPPSECDCGQTKEQNIQPTPISEKEMSENIKNEL